MSDFANMIPKQGYTSQPTQGFEERGTEEQLAKLYMALALARSTFGAIARDKEVTVKMNSGGSYKFAYAPMESLLSATTRPLAEQGLVVLLPFSRGDGKAVQWAILAHKDGGRLAFSTTFDPKSDTKEFGGQLTYYQRYAYRSLLTLAADEDMDSMPEQSRGEVSAERSQPARQPAQAARQSAPEQSKPQPQTRQDTPPSSPPPAQQNGAEHAARVKDMQDGLRALGYRTRAEAGAFVFAALNVDPGKAFPLGDPLGSSLSMPQLDRVMEAVVNRRVAQTQKDNV